MMVNKKTKTFRLKQDAVFLLERVAAAAGATQSDVLEQLLIRYASTFIKEHFEERCEAVRVFLDSKKSEDQNNDPVSEAIKRDVEAYNSAEPILNINHPNNARQGALVFQG